jgi:hypothetical protein
VNSEVGLYLLTAQTLRRLAGAGQEGILGLDRPLINLFLIKKGFYIDDGYFKAPPLPAAPAKEG